MDVLKKLTVLFLVMTSLLLISCNDKSIQETDLNMNENKIYPRELIQSEKDLLSLVGFNDTIEIFDFETDGSFKRVNIWLEVYEDGKLLEDRGKMSLNLDYEKGLIAVKVNKDETYDWRVSVKTKEQISSMAFESTDDFLKDESNSVASSYLEETLIENEKPIVLEIFLFDSDTSTTVYGLQSYEKNPEVLEEYDYAYLLKCEFSESESSDGQLEDLDEVQ